MRKWMLPILLGTLLIQVSCKNKSGITEGGESPTVRSTNPTNNASDIAVNTFISALFNDKMNPSTITDSTFMLKLDTAVVDGSLSYADSTAFFTPSANLLFGRTYTATITTGAQNLSGNSMNDNYEWQFTTISQETDKDTTPPQVVSTNPADNADGVSINISVSAIFSEPINSSTINANTFTLAKGSTPISGNVSYAGNTATLSLSTMLEFETTYTVTLSAAIEDTAGNQLGKNFRWNFSTGAQSDNTPPQVAETNPSDNEEDVSISTTITATFNEAIKTSTIDEKTFSVKEGEKTISGSFSFSGNSVEFTPSSPLSFERTYTVTIAKDVEDLAGNNLSSDYKWSFKTSDEPDGEEPEIDSRSPDNNQKDVDINTNITVTFNEAINPQSVNSSSFYLRANGSSISANYNTDGNTISLNPSGDLSYETTYTVTLTTEIEDLAGNNLTSNEQWNFTTSKEPDDTPPQLTSRSPQPNSTNIAIETNITATFSEAIKSSSVNAVTFTLERGNFPILANYNVSGGNTAVLNPLGNLAYGATYTVTLNSGGIEDQAGNELEDTIVWTFTTEQEPDNEAPKIVSRNPANNQQNVDVGTNITVTFDEPIRSSTINESTFFMRVGNTNIHASYSTSGNTATLNPSSDLAYETEYTVILTTGVEDLVGNNLENTAIWDFTTEDVPDTEKPKVDSMDPRNKQKDVEIGTNITVNFSESITSSTVNGSTFFLTADDTNIPGSYDISGNTVRFVPSSDLSYDTKYKATLTTGIEDLAGNSLDKTTTWEFTTEKAPDLTPPQVTSKTPQPNSSDVAIETDITATFSEDINNSTVNGTTFILEQGSAQVAAGYSVLGKNTAILNPDQDLEYGTTYAATLTTGIQDQAGNGLENSDTWTFTTEQETAPPRVANTNPGNGDTNISVQTIIMVSFNEAMNAQTVNANSFTVSLSNGGPISGSVNSTGNPNIFTFNPSTDLEFDGLYTAVITTGVEDLAGNNLEEDFIWSFSTDSISSNIANNEEN